MDNEKERFTVTLKPSLLLKHKDNPLNTNYCESKLTEIYLQQRNELLEAAQESEGMCKLYLHFKISQNNQVEVSKSGQGRSVCTKFMRLLFIIITIRLYVDNLQKLFL